MRSPFSILIDAVLILVFASVGRLTHGGEMSVGGVLATAWPFLVAGIVSSTIAWAFARWNWLVEGILVWVITVIGGLMLRVASGDSAELTFIFVATLMLGILLLGWRALASLLTRAKHAQPTP